MNSSGFYMRRISSLALVDDELEAPVAPVGAEEGALEVEATVAATMGEFRVTENDNVPQAVWSAEEPDEQDAPEHPGGRAAGLLGGVGSR